MYSTDFTGVNKSVESSFRDAISTVDNTGHRVWLYPRDPKGRLTLYRKILSYVLIGLMLSGPFMKIDGEPVLLLNILERKFIIFGNIFWPQDFHIFLLVMIAGVIFIGLFTVVYGRVFCGWVCPQTIFMENVFRRIEFWIEGDYKKRQALDSGPLNEKKIFKKGLKHAVFLAISFVIANTFLSYIVSIEKVFEIWSNPLAQPATLIPFVAFTFVFYWVFARFREQVCTTVCPYGRLQGVLLDKNSLIVAYDYLRGEKRGKFRVRESRKAAGKGDCIDCGHCVNVCPMGIDIRNGTQLECINCTACIDACNYIMDKTGQDKGLIRIASEAGIAEGKPFRFTTRIMAYSAVLLVLLGVIISLLVFRPLVETTVLRTPGIMYQELDNDQVSNLYNIKLINKTGNDLMVDLREVDGIGHIKLVGKERELLIPAAGSAEAAAFIILDKKDIKKRKTRLELGIFQGEKQLESVSTTFIGPVN